MTSKFALVIANTEYQDASFAKLTAPGKDAEEFAQVLRDLAVFDDVNVLLNEGEGKTRRSIARFFADRKRDDLLLLYFSGHGVRNEQGQLFLAANDTEISILEASGIPSDFVTQSMNNSRSQRQLLILDCCNSGAFAHGSKSATGVGKSMGIATAFEGSGFGRVVLTATDATQYAWEGDKVIGDTQKSVFTHFLIEGLKGEADRNGDGRIDVDELYDYAYDQVVSRTPKQTPGKWSYKQQGDIILRENLKPREIKPAPLPPELLEMLAHPNSGVRRAGLQELIGLLDGKHKGLARAARAKLLEIAENDDSLTLRRSVSDALKARGFVLEKVIEQGDFSSFQQGPVPDSIETPKVEHKAQKPAPTIEGKVEVLREKPAGVLLNWKSLVSRFNLRVLFGIGALLMVVSLAVAAFPALRDLFAPGVGSTKIGKDGMTLLYVPASEFTMGNDNDSADEKPVHTVYLDAFWIDQTEVTNAMYAKCVDADVCEEPTNKISSTHPSYYGNAEFDNYPVIYVDWNMAKTYCEWADRRLPTEAEWEKAARGTDGNVYPWGNSFDGTLVNFCDTNCSFDWADKSFDDKYADVAPVGSYPSGKSIYGALDMAGNVWEWVSSLYQPYPYDPADGRENLTSSDGRALRGGSWYLSVYEVRSARRNGLVATYTADDDIGFRCAVSANRQTDITPLAQASTNIPSATQTSQSVKTDTPSPTETTIPLTQTSISPTPTLGIGSKLTGKDGMTLLYIPEGGFTMGSIAETPVAECQQFSSECPASAFTDESPPHDILLDSYWIDQTEVTNKMYALCVSEGVCTAPLVSNSATHPNYYGNPEFDSYPVIQVNWIRARSYCEWAGRRLPTEAEWEKAARGTDERIYPWGNEFDGTRVNFCDKNCPHSAGDRFYDDGFADTAPVGRYPNGASPYGALDMAGNVWEWVFDKYASNYYYLSPPSNPPGPDSSNYHVLRGGSWGYLDSIIVRSAYRGWGTDDYATNFVGFRCAMDAP